MPIGVSVEKSLEQEKYLHSTCQEKKKFSENLKENQFGNNMHICN